MTASGQHIDGTDSLGYKWIASDTVCIYRGDIVKVLTGAERGKLLALKVAQYKKDSAVLNARIAQKETTITALRKNITLNAAKIKTFEKEIVAMKDQRRVYDGLIVSLNKEIKRERRKRTWVTILGVIGAVGGIYLGASL